MAGSDAAGLDFEGDFPAGASASAGAADELTKALAKLNDVSARSRDPKIAEASQYKAITGELEHQAALEAKIATFDANRVRQIAALKAQYKSMEAGALGKGPALPDATAKIETGAFVLAGAAEKVFDAGVKIIEGAAALTVSAAQLAIAQTSKREVQTPVFEKLGGSFRETEEVALKLGVDPDKAVAEAKGLLNAKFKGTEVPVLLRLAAGADQVKEGAGGELLDKLQKLKLEPKVNEKDIKGLWAVGLDAKQVYQALAKELGTDVPTAMAKVKSGTADAEQVIRAIETVGETSFGKFADIAADAVPALANRARVDLLHMFAFDPSVLQPIKDVLHNVLEVLEGSEGQALKNSMQELFSALSHAFLDEFRGEEGKAKLKAFAKGAADAIHEFAQAVHEAQPAIQMLERLGEKGVGGAPDGIKGYLAPVRMLVDGLTSLSKALDTVNAATGLHLDLGDILSAPLTIVEAFNPVGPFLTETLPNFFRDGFSMVGNYLLALPGELAGAALDTGTAIVDGLVEGIESGAARAIAAAKQLGDRTVQAVRDAVGYGSPATEFIETGRVDADEGMAIGMGGGRSAAAGRGLGLGALAGARGAGGDAGGSGAGGGMIITFAPNIVLPPGSPAENAAAVRRSLAEAYPEFLALARRAAREAQDGSVT